MEVQILVAGPPSAGKSTLADRLEASDLALTHVPLDRYIRAVPVGVDFYDWVQRDDSIDWPVLTTHLAVLEAGRICYSPRPDWGDRGRWLCAGGDRDEGVGRRMRPSDIGCVIPGTQSFACPPGAKRVVRVYVETPEETLAARAAERPRIVVPGGRGHDGRYDPALTGWIRALRDTADLVVSGTDSGSAQLAAIRACCP